MVLRNEPESRPYIDYGGMGMALRMDESPQKRFVSYNKKILHKPTRKVVDDVISIGIASHSITPTTEQLKTNLLAYVVGAATFFELGGDPKFERKDCKDKKSEDSFKMIQGDAYRRFKYYLHQEVKMEEKHLLYTQMLPNVIKRINSVSEEREIFIFEGDSLGVNIKNDNGGAIEAALLTTLKTSRRQIRLIGIHTSFDYLFSNIFYDYFGEHRIDGYILNNTHRLLKRLDSFVLPCMRVGERTALFRNPNNNYTLSFYCKLDIPKYDIDPFQVDIFTGRQVGDRFDPVLIEGADEVADVVMSMLSDIERIHITADDPMGRMIGKNRVLVDSLANAYDSIFKNMYYDKDNMGLNVLKDIYESEAKL